MCISRPEGAGGAEVGRIVSERLGFAYVDEEIVAAAAAKGGISAADVADEEQRKRALGRLLQEIGRGASIESYGLGGMVWPLREEATPDGIRALIQQAIEETAARGDVVIVSHAASHALAGREGVLRVLVTASPDTRARRLADARGLEPKEAAQAVKEADTARADYLRRFYGISAEAATQYDLVVNTDVLGVERAAALVAAAASA